jgi:hypothetical protein
MILGVPVCALVDTDTSSTYLVLTLEFKLPSLPGNFNNAEYVRIHVY